MTNHTSRDHPLPPGRTRRRIRARPVGTAGPPSPSPVPSVRGFVTPVRGHAFAAPPPVGPESTREARTTGAVWHVASRGDTDASGRELPPEGLELPAVLAREPDNPADAWAVAVWAVPSRSAVWRIGYLDRSVAARLAPRLDGGLRLGARLEGWIPEPQGRWRRPALRVWTEPEADEAAEVVGTGVASPTTDAAGRSVHEERPRAGEGDHSGGRGPGGAWGRPPGVRRRRIASARVADGGRR